MENKSCRELETVAGEVVCTDLAQPRAVQRFVQKWIGRWVERRRPLALKAKPYFHVIFARQGKGHTILCQIRLAMGDEVWVGANYGQNLAEALRRGLDHLSVVRPLAPILKTVSAEAGTSGASQVSQQRGDSRAIRNSPHSAFHPVLAVSTA